MCTPIYKRAPVHARSSPYALCPPLCSTPPLSFALPSLIVCGDPVTSEAPVLTETIAGGADRAQQLAEVCRLSLDYGTWGKELLASEKERERETVNLDQGKGRSGIFGKNYCFPYSRKTWQVKS